MNQELTSGPARVVERVAQARAAQARWAQRPIRERLRVLRRFRAAAAVHGADLARSTATARQRPLVESLTAEVLPLLEAVRFLERCAARILAPRPVGWRGRPIWLWGHRAVVQREARGVVLILAPGNYPLLLPAVQALQALAAGNAVLWKPAPGGLETARRCAELLSGAGLPDPLLQVLPETIEAGLEALHGGVDQVVLTGGAETGRRVLAEAAPHLTPVTAELSGADAFIVRADADLAMAARALVFGLSLNAGATCIAPRRLLVQDPILPAFERHLREALAARPGFLLPPAAAALVREPVERALASGAVLLAGEFEADGRVRGPLIAARVPPNNPLHHDALFAPVTVLLPFVSDDEAVRLANASDWALGASVFSRDVRSATGLAARLVAGVVTINDLIVPTADPRLPFGGRRQSGFGVTRGEEGLLEMTVPKVITRRGGRWRPHYAELPEIAAGRVAGLVRFLHGHNWLTRLGGLRDLWHPRA